MAALREEPLRWSSLRSNFGWSDIRSAYGMFVVVPAVLGLVAAIIWSAAAGIANSDPELEYRSQLRMLFEFPNLPAAQRSAKRKDLAKWLIFLQEQKVQTDVIGGPGTLYSGDERLKASENSALNQDLAVLRHVAATGETPVYPKSSNKMLDELISHLPLLARFVVLLHGGLPFWLYVSFSVRQGVYLVDLRWRAVWPVILVVLTVLPWGLPFYVVSALRLHILRRHDPPEHLKYDSDPLAGKQAYTLLRNAKWQEYLATYTAEVNKLLQGVEGTLQALGERLRSEQRARNTLISEANKIAALREHGHEAPEPGTIDDEFDALMKIPGVAGARAMENGLSVLVCARLTYEDIVYDLGDWDIRVSPTKGLRALELRSGMRPDWPFGRYPVYRLGDGSFCFGEHSDEISLAMKQGRILEAIRLAATYIQSVNVEHRADIERAFLAALEGPLIIP